MLEDNACLFYLFYLTTKQFGNLIQDHCISYPNLVV